jgi:TctA family transporter
MLVALVAIVFALGSWQGLVLMTICTGIGLIQITFRTRWMNCMGILLVPIFLNMAGWGPRIVEFLGLV